MRIKKCCQSLYIGRNSDSYSDRHNYKYAGSEEIVIVVARNEKMMTEQGKQNSIGRKFLNLSTVNITGSGRDLENASLGNTVISFMNLLS